MAKGKTNGGAGRSSGANCGENLFHNWYFVGGGTVGKFPVNQKGKTSWTADGYMFDRWIVDVGTGGSVSLAADGLVLNTNVSSMSISQRLENILAGVTHTASVFVDGVIHSASGIFPVKGGADVTWGSSNGVTIRASWPSADGSETFPEVFFDFAQSSAARKVVAACLELGDKQTLVVEKNGSLILNQYTDYGEELNKCLRFYYDSSNGVKITYDNIIYTYAVSKTAGLPFEFPAVMRAVPAITFYSSVDGTIGMWDATSGTKTTMTHGAIGNKRTLPGLTNATVGVLYLGHYIVNAEL